MAAKVLQCDGHKGVGVATQKELPEKFHPQDLASTPDVCDCDFRYSAGAGVVLTPQRWQFFFGFFSMQPLKDEMLAIINHRNQPQTLQLQLQLDEGTCCTFTHRAHYRWRLEAKICKLLSAFQGPKNAQNQFSGGRAGIVSGAGTLALVGTPNPLTPPQSATT